MSATQVKNPVTRENKSVLQFRGRTLIEESEGLGIYIAAGVVKKEEAAAICERLLRLLSHDIEQVPGADRENLPDSLTCVSDHLAMYYSTHSSS